MDGFIFLLVLLILLSVVFLLLLIPIQKPNIKIISGGWEIVQTTTITNDDLKHLYNMYITTYKSSKQDIWFKSSDDLKRYDCMAYILREQGIITSAIMYQPRDYGNKISLLLHDNTSDGKKHLMDGVAKLLTKKGWYLEAAGAVSWVLRSRYTTPIVKDKKMIEKCVIRNKKTEKIVLNDNFNKDDKDSYFYKHIYDESGQTYINNETLFGIPCEEKCERTGYKCELKKRLDD